MIIAFVGLDMSAQEKAVYTIGVNPDAGTGLKGLGREIEARETEKRNQLGLERPCSDPDPWYFGQGHEYGLIASPGNGSVLQPEEIRKIHQEWVPE